MLSQKNNFIIDFDDVLFDIPKVKEALTKQELEVHWRHASLWNYLKPFDYLHTDVKAWLKEHSKNGDSLHVLTVYQDTSWSFDAKDFQMVKVEKSCIANYVDTVHVVPGVKADHLSELIMENKVNIFIDDSPDEILEVQKRFPLVHCVRMRRPGAFNNVVETPINAFEALNLNEIDSLDFLSA